jgi:hypothetical protein
MQCTAKTSSATASVALEHEGAALDVERLFADDVSAGRHQEGHGRDEVLGLLVTSDRPFGPQVLRNSGALRHFLVRGDYVKS